MVSKEEVMFLIMRNKRLFHVKEYLVNRKVLEDLKDNPEMKDVEQRYKNMIIDQATTNIEEFKVLLSLFDLKDIVRDEILGPRFLAMVGYYYIGKEFGLIKGDKEFEEKVKKLMDEIEVFKGVLGIGSV